MSARLGAGVEDFCRKVLDAMGRMLAEEIVGLALAKDGVAWSKEDFAPGHVLDRLLDPGGGRRLGLSASLAHPVVLLGAPAAVLAPFLRKRLQARVLAPPSCQVASAVGAAASAVALSRKVDIVTLPDFSGFRAFLPEGLMDDTRMERLVDRASDHMRGYMLSLARLAGSQGGCQVGVSRVDREARLGDGTRLVMGVQLTFTALSAA
jgi:hypothetical protein